MLYGVVGGRVRKGGRVLQIIWGKGLYGKTGFFLGEFILDYYDEVQKV